MQYTAKSGDTLGTIAAKYLGSSSRWKEIWDANPQITNPDLIYVGQSITIPEVYGPFLPDATQSSTLPAQSAAVKKSSFDFNKLLSDPKMLIAVAGGSLLLVFMLTSKNKTTSST